MQCELGGRPARDRYGREGMPIHPGAGGPARAAGPREARSGRHEDPCMLPVDHGASRAMGGALATR